MKKLFIAFALALLSNVGFAQGIAQPASKVLYSNQVAHLYLTAVAINDSTMMYSISETSNRHIWRLTDNMETQSLGMFDKETTIEIFKQAKLMWENDSLGTKKDIGHNIRLRVAKVKGNYCIELKNTFVGSSFNIDKKTIIGALQALGVQVDSKRKKKNK